MGWFFWAKPEYAVLAAEPEDNPAMAEIHAASFPRPWSEDEIASLLSGPGMQAWVAKPEGRSEMAGFLILREAGGEAEVITVATAPAARRTGAGHALMLAAIRHCRADGLERLLLEVGENNSPAIALYRSLGFRQISTRKGYYSSHSAPGAKPPAALVMELDLR